jgi:hypothetical protein
MKKLIFILSIILAVVAVQTAAANNKPASKKAICKNDSTCTKMTKECSTKKCCSDTACCTKDKKCSKEACCKKSGKAKMGKSCSKDSCNVKAVKGVKKEVQK